MRNDGDPAGRDTGAAGTEQSTSVGTGNDSGRTGSGEPSGAARTDGGPPGAPGERSRQRRLQSLFVDVTGTEELVERRTDASSARRIDDGDESTVSEYVTSVAKNDGLSDAIPEPGTESGLD